MTRPLLIIALASLLSFVVACSGDDDGDTNGDGDGDGDGDTSESTGGAASTGGSPGSGGSEPGPIGSPCRSASQCAAVNGRSHYCSLYGFQDGHCSLNCADSTECDETSECREWNGSIPEDEGGSAWPCARPANADKVSRAPKACARRTVSSEFSAPPTA